MDSATLVAAMDFAHSRLLGILSTIEKTAAEKNIPVQQILGWRPGPGRAHIGWQAIHCAATHDKYLNVNLLGKPGPQDSELIAQFGGGTTPSDQNVPDLAKIRTTLESSFTPLRNYARSLDSVALERKIPGPNNTQRSVGEAIILLTWHDAHHQGQIHLTWNLYKAANRI